MKLIDTHCHLFYYKEQMQQVLQESRESNVKCIINVGTTLQNSADIVVNINEPDVFHTIGIHPDEAVHYPTKNCDIYHSLENLITEKVVGIGETGIDLYQHTHSQESPLQYLQQQINLFEQQLELAYIKSLPLIVHTRSAELDTIQFLTANKHRIYKTVMHCFTGSVEFVKQLLHLGCYISFSGIVTFKSAHVIREAVKIVPLDRILCETDAPYLAPVPHRGQQNRPMYISHTVAALAQIRNEPIELLTEAIYNNAKFVFNITI